MMHQMKDKVGYQKLTKFIYRTVYKENKKHIN